MCVGDACPVSRIQRTVLACQTASHVLGIDCQCGSPLTAASPIRTAPSTTPAAATRAGPRDIDSSSASVSLKRFNTIGKPAATAVTTTRAKNAVKAFHGMPTAPNGTIASATTP